MNKIKFIFVVAAFLMCYLIYSTHQYTKSKCNIEFNRVITKADPPCLQMYFYIKKYAEIYDIPLEYAYGLAYQETGYRGPFHWKYDHKQTSSVGALGPMQIMDPTADWLAGENINHTQLKEDIELNVRLSLKYLRYLKDKYIDWKKVFGAYNSGKPIINQYALNIYNKNYNWDK